MVYLLRTDFLNSFNIVRAVWASCHRNEFGEVNIDNFVINSVSVRGEFYPVFFTTLCSHERFCYLVRREYRGSCTEFGTHICDSCSFGDCKSFYTLSAVFDNFADTALNGHDTKNFKDNVFSGNPSLKFTCKIYTNHFRHGNIVSTAAHSNSNIKTACTDSKHTDTTACWSVAIRAYESFAGLAKSFKMYLMADTVAGTGEVNAMLFADGLNKSVVISIFKACLESVVVDVGNAFFSFDSRHADSLKFEVSHSTCSVLCQSLVDFKTDFRANGHITAEQVRFNNFLSDSVAHNKNPPLKEIQYYYPSKWEFCQSFYSRKNEVSQRYSADTVIIEELFDRKFVL